MIKKSLYGRSNFKYPIMVEKSIPFSKKIGIVTEPAVAMRKTIKVEPGEKIEVDLIISVDYKKEIAIENLKKYIGNQNIKRTFELSKARVEAESRYLGIKGKEIELYQRLLSYILFDNPARKNDMKSIIKEKYKQNELWKYGISGDLPIILVTIKDVNDIYVLEQALKAYEFFKSKNIETEIVIIDEENHDYVYFLKDEIETCILNNQMAYLKNIKGGIFKITKDEISKVDINLLKFVSSINVDSDSGTIENGIQDLEREYLEDYDNSWEDKVVYNFEDENKQNIDILENIQDLKFYNEYGAFSKDGKEYLIRINKESKLPTVWSHILTNEKIGTIVTENMGGYTWNKNSRLKRITAWCNYPNLDIPSEIIYLKDLKNGNTWSLGANPMPDNNNYNIIYGFGYAKFIHYNSGIIQEDTIFIPKNDPVKTNIIKLKNTTPNKKKLKIIYYTKCVLGEDETKSDGFINLNYEANSNMIYLDNLFEREVKQNTTFISSSEKIKSFTGDKSFFFGKGGLENPDGINKTLLNDESGLGTSSCAAIEIEVEIESYSEKEISLVLGTSESLIEARDLSYKYSKINNCNQELNKIKKYWEELLKKVVVQTPLESVNIMLNGWTLYQTICSRLIGRSGYYQSGGAYGFRDQLQDSLCTKYINPELLKNQIIKHSKRQFLEGDVEHWWHDETNRGIRTRFSDDMLWLVFAVIEYINFTGDLKLLNVETRYLHGEALREGTDEKYDLYEEGEIKESVLKHCIRAIDRSLKFGENGFPKIGSGDWNDGFNKVGNKGRGESVWLGFFLYYILDNFINIIETITDKDVKDLDIDEIKIKYKNAKEDLKKHLNKEGWDGRWFKRAFMDDGSTLGSIENEECRIDSICQSWGIISNAADNDKKYISIKSFENHLVDKELGIIKLLDPPFNKANIDPGYIKAYMPGVRENGGQYTHAAVWAIIAESILGFGDNAVELYKMINPIEHSSFKELANKYKVEPYVIPADIYGCGNIAGRGGWTWYTGSSSWYYKAGIEYILGLKISKGVLKLKPCVPKDWEKYRIRYEYKSSSYDITVDCKNNNSNDVLELKLDGQIVENKQINMINDGKIHEVEVVLK